MPVLALDLGGTKLASTIFSAGGTALSRRVVPLENRRGAAVGDLITAEITAQLDLAQARRLAVSAVGISVPGISYAATGRVWAPNIPGWKAYPLRREVESVIRRRAARSRPRQVLVESDRACYILGETWRGAARGSRNAIFLAVGTGIGAGILVEGQVLRGANDIAGAIGWLALDRPFARRYMPCGCFEYHASGRGLAKVARGFLRRAQPAGRSRPSPLGACRPLTARDIFAALEGGDAVAKRVLAQAVEFWGMAVANLVSLFNPEQIIFGGGVFGPATRFLDDIYAEAVKWAQPIAIRQVKLVGSKLGADAGLYGAGWLALRGGMSGV
jgi:glucokinase